MTETDSARLTLLLRFRDGANQLSWQEFHEPYGHLLYKLRSQSGGRALPPKTSSNRSN